jgi:hypothetical protein
MEKQQEETITPEKAPGIFRASWILARKSLSLLRQDANIIFFPVFFGFFTVLILAGFFVLRQLYLGSGGYMATGTFLFLWFIILFIATFAKYGITVSLRSRLIGKPISITAAFNKTTEKIQIIFEWAFIASAVGVLLFVLAKGIYSLLFVGLLGVYWNLATYFIIPSFTEEKVKSLSEALIESVLALKRSWKEMVIINIGFYFALSLVTIPVKSLLDIFNTIFPFLVHTTPMYAGVAFLFLLFLKFIVVFLAIFAWMYQLSYDLVLYSKDIEISESVVKEKKTARRKLAAPEF